MQASIRVVELKSANSSVYRLRPIRPRRADNSGNSRANTCVLGPLQRGPALRDQNQRPSGFIPKTLKPADRARPGRPEGSPTYQLVGRAAAGRGHNGYRGSGSGPGEVALKTAPTSKEGSRRATFPMGALRYPEDATEHTDAGLCPVIGMGAV